uniref:Ribonuclease H-like domain-containing protein n=1 Tax=Tanacetum cinerariifolium TaxID=118510 RepID=A0A699H4M7_TANCI|nr:ribonuclease H-like domain-containing protein [Tanacetum cinerariifolium]
MKEKMALRCRACDGFGFGVEVSRAKGYRELVDEDEDPQEDEFEEEDDIEVDIEEDENELELTYPYEEMDPLNPTLHAFMSEPEDAIEVESPIEHEDETVLASVHKVGESSTAPFLHEDSDGLLPGLMKRDINSIFGTLTLFLVGMASLSRRLCGRETTHALVEKKGKAKDEFYGKLILELGNKICSIVEQGTYAMEKLVEKLSNAEENGNSFKPVPRTTANEDGTSTSTIPGPVTTKEKAQKKNDVKAKSMLLMALPNEHLLTFSQYKDAKTLFEAIQEKFGGNDATKKTQRTLLKQMYENFNAPSIENKADLDTLSIDDLYNNFKIVKQEVKRTVTTSLGSGSQNMAFLSSPGSTNEFNTANIQVSAVSTPVSTVSTHDNTANLSDATVYAFLANKPNGSQLRTGKKITINGSETAGYVKKKVECFNCHKMGHFARECRSSRNHESRLRNQDSLRKTVNVEDTSSKAMVVIEGACFDWCYMADDEAPTNMALMAFSDSEIQNKFNKSKFDLATYKRGIESVEEQLVFYKKNEDSKSVCVDTSNEIKKALDAPIIEDWVFDSDDDESEVMVLKTDNVQHKPEQANQPRKMVQKPVLKNVEKGTVLTKSGIVPISTARQNSSRAATPGDPQDALKDQGYFDRGGAKGGKITGNGTIRAGKLDFEDVYFVKELQFNIFSVSQMCDKSVLFTDTKCFVMSPNFKLADESHVLLKVPRKNNMYNFDVKNIVPQFNLSSCKGHN